MRKILLVLGTLVLLSGLSLAWWLRTHEPTPIEELLPSDADIDLAAYDGSMSPEAGSPDVMILGSPHLAQTDYGYRPEDFDRLTAALSRYEPDLVVVEYLPPEYPRGKGRDYRPDFDLAHYADEWGMDAQQADSLLAAYRASEAAAVEPCALAKAYFLARDFVNASYYWLSGDCRDAERHEEIARWLERRSQHEMAKIGFPVARASGVRELVSFDYQGEDAEWFIGRLMQDLASSGRLWAAKNFWSLIPKVGTMSREWEARENRHAGEGELHAALHMQNSPEWIGLQYWAYEHELRGVEYNNEHVGAHQTENYWLRNERMFAHVQEAIDEHDPERVLVIVGSGHKYFLDKLTREAGYRWIDPRDWLPSREAAVQPESDVHR